MDGTRLRALLVNATVMVISLLLVALAAEVALRVALTRSLNPFERDDEIGFRLRADFDGVYPRVRVRTDSHGHRIPTDQEVDDTGRYLFMGDSVTFAFSVPAAVGFPVRVATALGTREDATNAAVPGYNLEQALVAVRRQVARRRPEWILYGLVVNDLSASLRPGQYSDIDPHAARAGSWLSSSYLVSFILRRAVRIQRRFEFDEPADKPVGTQAAGSSSARDPHNLPPGPIQAFDHQWQMLEQVQAEVSVPIFVLVSPHRQQVEESDDDSLQTFIAERCEGSNLVCLDPLQMFRDHAAEGLFTGRSSYHFSDHGHDLLARFLLTHLENVAAGAR